MRSGTHTRTMHNVVTDFRRKLRDMRGKQRDDQKQMEKEEQVELTDIISHCDVCELDFKTDPKKHEANELHNEIKTLIYQKCDICDVEFRVWKVYFHHMCAFEHCKVK